MKIANKQTFIFFIFLLAKWQYPLAQGRLFEEPKPNTISVSMGTLLFSEMGINYYRMFNLEQQVWHGFSASASYWYDIDLFDELDEESGTGFSMGYVLQQYGNSRKNTYNEFKIGLKLLSSKSLDNHSFYSGVALPNNSYAEKYRFMPYVFLGNAVLKSNAYVRYGVGFPSLVSFAFGFRF